MPGREEHDQGRRRQQRGELHPDVQAEIVAPVPVDDAARSEQQRRQQAEALDARRDVLREQRDEERGAGGADRQAIPDQGLVAG